MIITAMHNWRPEPGTALEWHPTPRARQLALAAPVDDTPPSFLQDGHIRSYRSKHAKGERHRAYLGATTEVDADLDEDALTRALQRFVLRHEGLRTTFSVDGDTIVRHLIDVAAIEFEIRDVGPIADDAQFRAYVDERFGREATPIGWPGFSFGAVRRPGSFTLYYGTDHAFSDGASQILVIAELIDLYRSETEGTDAVDTSEISHSFLDYAELERQAARAVTPDSPAVAEWTRILSARGGVMPRFPMDLGLQPGETAPVRPVERDLLDATDAEAFEKICHESGARTIGGIFAAVAITDHELAGAPDYVGITVLSTRGHEYAVSQGWFCNFSPVAFDVVGARTFTELASVAQQGYARAKALASEPVHAVLGTLIASGVAGPEVASSPNLLSYIDFRRFPGAGSPTDARAVLFTGEGRTANASMWINRDHRHLYLGSQTPDTVVARENIERYHRHLAAVFAAVARHGDYVITDPNTTKDTSAGHHD
ncbi:condensation domain-containing protein [Actinomycetes bacterium M1A6_2h]